MPKVLHITDKPSPGGGTRSIVDLYREFAVEHGWQSELFRLVHRGHAHGNDRHWAPVRNGKNRWSPQSSGVALETALQNIDIVHLHLGFTAIGSGFVKTVARGRPLIVSLHDVSPFLHQRAFSERNENPKPGLIERIRQWYFAPSRQRLWHTLCTEAETVLVPSEYLAGLATEFGAADRKIRILHHPVSNTVAPGLAPSECRQVIVFAGSLIFPKGVSLLLEAFSLPGTEQAELVFVGGGSLRQELENSANQFGCADRVRFRGQVSEFEVRREMANARVVVHPSLVPEGFGLTGVEAMSVGRPVVGFGLGGTKDWLIHRQTGLIAQKTDANALAGCLVEILNDDALADRLGKAGQEMVGKKFDRAAISNKLIAIYRGLLDGAR